jgi:hypothetical protein
MHPSLQPLFDQLESLRQSILASFRDFTADQLNQRPRPNQWSAAEVLSHLVTAERLSVTYLTKKLQGIDSLGRTGLWEEFKMGLLIISQRLPGLKFKAPRRVIESTTAMTSLPDIEAAWNAVRQDLRILLERLPENGMDRKVYRHPVAGYLNIKHTLAFFREHLIHHGPQLRRLLNP